MKVAREHYKSPKDLPREEALTPGSPLCAGCGGLTALRLIHKVLGEDVVIVNAAGCMTLLATYPFTPVKSSWLYTTMASAPAGAQGVRDALDILQQTGRLPAEANRKVLVLAGDGSTYGMGLSATSAAIERGLDFWYLCYDNEAYGNTGFQLSGASPEGSHTSTSLDEHTQHKKDIFGIWLA
ncbi:MAG: pyruvate synthase, partial [Planctomycetaceae bacterium]